MINGAILLVPLFLVRYGLLAVLSREALARAAHFPPVEGRERIAYWAYQGATVAMVVCLFFLKIRTDAPWFYFGLAVYGLGVLLLVLGAVDFARPAVDGLRTRGLYRLSRNPMYVAYFVYFLGCVVLTRSYMLLAMLLVFQVSAHWIILAEERWCRQAFGERYDAYRRSVRRYF